MAVYWATMAAITTTLLRRNDLMRLKLVNKLVAYAVISIKPQELILPDSMVIWSCTRMYNNLHVSVWFTPFWKYPISQQSSLVVDVIPTKVICTWTKNERWLAAMMANQNAI